LKTITLLFATFIGGVFLFSFNPTQSNLYPPCLFHKLTGLYCPGCGSLRALHQLLHGHLLTALSLNPLMVLMLPFLGYAFTSRIFLLIRGKALPRIFIPAFWLWFLFAVIIAYWILRNIPFFPFNYLAP
jgi:hypothetical protein